VREFTKYRSSFRLAVLSATFPGDQCSSASLASMYGLPSVASRASSAVKPGGGG